MYNKTNGEYRFAREYYGEFATIRNQAGISVKEFVSRTNAIGPE